MQAMIDHTAAVVIGAMILLIVLAMGVRSQDSAIEATQVDLAKTELRLLIDTIEQDFNNMGSGMANPNASAADRVVRSYTESSGTYELTFAGLQDDAGPPDPVEVTYRWQQNGTTTFPDGTTADTYEVERVVGGITTTFGTATDFTLTLRKDSNILGFAPVPSNSIADSLALVRYVDVAVGMIPPVGNEDLLQQTLWSKRFRPINLNIGKRKLIAAKPGF